MALDTAPATAPTTPHSGISPDNFLSSLGRTLAMVGLLTIFTLAITAIVKTLAIYVINKLRQPFRPPADPVEIPEVGQPADPEEVVGGWHPAEPEEIDGEWQPAEPEEIHEEALPNVNLTSLAIE